ncbi:MAG: DNA methyltransferase [Rhizobiales bacterium 62-47]|nr:N-6 DNA methylase [Hyphomicrobiales bacterium]OJY14205.1 MAG: DNA methyltransferase [Rhizobiales bacterium 62-47]
MGQVLIQRYLNDLDRIRSASGATRETVVREAFKDLLKQWGRQQDLIFIAEHEHIGPTKNRCYVDGALLHEIRVPFGYWEAKDTNDKLDEEIEKKKRKGYPQDNIIFEDSRHAVLIQDRQEIIRCAMADAPSFEKLLSLFFRYERKEIAEFRKAVDQFKADLPSVLKALREKIEEAHVENAAYQNAEIKFLKHAKETINPTLGMADVREMLIQHILTEEIFAKVFDDSEFHTHNNIAKELYTLEETFFTGGLKKQTLRALDPYYAAIRASAAQITSHSEKQTFLKVIYENFYKVYNSKAADRLGVVYTPNEIVRFMIHGADWLCRSHFKRGLIDKDVEILDPATGTGTFITELIDYFRGDREKLAHKYQNELHANEVAILPYYVANLNIESTYASLTSNYAEFQNLCFVDTLDNIAPLGLRAGHQHELFGSFSEENVKRVKRQNARRISVIIGNPPYNANQMNENDNNKNRDYPKIDELIKATYVKSSTAQKTKVYDMYARFFRWASDRLDINGDGIIAFITNRSFIESRTFDGFRKAVSSEFNEVWLYDLGGDVRANPKLSGTKHNVFGIQTGVAISFFVRKRGVKGCTIRYARQPEYATAEEKLSFLATHDISSIQTRELTPDKKNNWINGEENDFADLMPLADRQTKGAKNKRQERAIFKLFASGIKTNRDEWVYDFDGRNLLQKAQFFSERFNHHLAEGSKTFDPAIKWSRDLKKKKTPIITSERDIVTSEFRPFVMKRYLNNKVMSDILTSMHVEAFGKDLAQENTSIAFLCVYSSHPLASLAVNGPFDYCMLKTGNGGTESVPRWRYTSDGERIDNITDWALNRFIERYGKSRPKNGRSITKDAIFNYVYGVLHDPVYREKYALNLRREFPRIPLYPDFWAWDSWGRSLMNLHVGFQTAELFPLKRTDTADSKSRKAGVSPKIILKSNKTLGKILIDSETTLEEVPFEAWNYLLGNRSAIDWILDQYKEKNIRDATIKQRFSHYRFADHKEQVIELLRRVITVSIRTLTIVAEMQEADRATSANANAKMA